MNDEDMEPWEDPMQKYPDNNQNKNNEDNPIPNKEFTLSSTIKINQPKNDKTKKTQKQQKLKD